MVQTPNLVTGQVVKQPETDLIIAAIRAWSQLVKDLLLAQLNAIIPGGFALSAASGTPIKINYAQGVAILAGYDIAVPAGSLTLAAADPTYHRYDLLTVAYSQTTPSDSAGQPTTLDTATPTVVTGTPSGSPTLPALPAGSVQLGWVDVPPGVTTASQCTIHPLLGPLAPNNLQDLTNHIAAAFSTTGLLHGYLVTAPGGTGAGRLLVGDGAYGAAGVALLLLDAGGTSRQLTQYGSGLHAASAIPIYNPNGRVEDSEDLGGQPPSYYAAASGLSAHTGADVKAAQVHGLTDQLGDIATSASGSGASGSVTFPAAYPGTPNVQLTPVGSGGGFDYGVTARSSTGFSWFVTGGGPASVTLQWRAGYIS